MDMDKTSNIQAAEIGDDTDSFTKVKANKCQKRKREPDAAMDTEATVGRKRPQFPPVSGDKLKVIREFWVKIKKNGSYLLCFRGKRNSFGAYLKLAQC